MKNLKKIVLVVALGLGVFATSCSNDDNEGETIVPLQGKYNLSKQGIVAPDGSEQLVDAAENQSGCPGDYLELKLSNSAVVGDYEGSACALTETTGTYVNLIMI